MKALSQEIMALDFQRVGKKYAMTVVVALVAAIGLGAFLLWPQLGETWTLLTQGTGPLEWRMESLADAWEWSLAGYGGGVLSAVGLGARTTLLVSGLVIAALAAGYWLLVALWLYQLAARADMGGVLWLLLGLAGNLVAVAAFFAARGLLCIECPECGAWSSKASGYCRHCGTDLAARCPVCGQSVALTDGFCSHCGAPLTQVEE